jgi:RHS repeat-associated protein
LPDRLGSLREVLDKDGVLKDALAYDGFGNITSESDPTWGGRYKYTGREWDVELELQYSRARYYDPRTARWTSQDPKGFDAGDSNLYRYVMNQHTRATDPSGLSELVVRDSIEKGKKELLYQASFLWVANNGRPVWIGTWDPQTNLVWRNGWLAKYQDVKAAAEKPLGTMPDWDSFFKPTPLQSAPLGNPPPLHKLEPLPNPLYVNGKWTGRGPDPEAVLASEKAARAEWERFKAKVQMEKAYDLARQLDPGVFMAAPGTAEYRQRMEEIRKEQYQLRIANGESKFVLFLEGIFMPGEGALDKLPPLCPGPGGTGGKGLPKRVNPLPPGLPPLREGYHYRDLGGGRYSVARNPGQANNLPPIHRIIQVPQQTTSSGTTQQGSSSSTTAAPATPRVADINPRADTLRPIHPVGHNPASVARAQNTVPFNQTLSDAQQAIQVVEYNGNYYVVSGHHRVYGLRNLHPPETPAPATVRVQVFTPEEYVRFPNADPVLRNMDNLMNVIRNSEAAGARFPISGGQ